MAENTRQHTKAFLYAPLTGVLLGALTAYTIHGTTGVHIPLLVAVVSGIILGFLDAKKGWIAALVQSLTLIAGVLAVGRAGDVPEIEMHSLIGSVGLTLVGSFIGAFIKRAFDS